MFNTILGAPSCIYSIIYPQARILLIQAPIVTSLGLIKSDERTLYKAPLRPARIYRILEGIRQRTLKDHPRNI